MCLTSGKIKKWLFSHILQLLLYSNQNCKIVGRLRFRGRYPGGKWLRLECVLLENCLLGGLSLKRRRKNCGVGVFCSRLSRHKTLWKARHHWGCCRSGRSSRRRWTSTPASLMVSLDVVKALFDAGSWSGIFTVFNNFEFKWEWES